MEGDVENAVLRTGKYFEIGSCFKLKTVDFRKLTELLKFF